MIYPKEAETVKEIFRLYTEEGQSISYIANGKVMTDDEFSVLNYFAVDGFKFTNVTLVHDRNKACQNIGGTKWTNAQFGGQGDLTQVFKTEDGYVITVIHTFLAEVKSVTKNNKYSHATPESATVNVWMQNAKEAAAFNNDPPYTPYEPNPETAQVKAVTNVDYAVGTKVLVNLTLKKDEATNYASYYSWGDGKDSAAATIVAAADSKTGKLTGASNAAYAESVSIDGTKYPGACRFVLGEDDAMMFANYGKNFTFYFDTYGNVIGCTEPTTAASYVVMVILSSRLTCMISTARRSRLLPLRRLVPSTALRTATITMATMSTIRLRPSRVQAGIMSS